MTSIVPEFDRQQQLSMAIRELADLRKLLCSLLGPEESNGSRH